MRGTHSGNSFFFSGRRELSLVSFQSRSEAYLHVIYILKNLGMKYPGVQVIEQGVENAKILFENHEQSMAKLRRILQDVFQVSFIQNESRQQLLSLIDALDKNNFEQSLDDKFKNPLARRYESDIGITLLLNPTARMLESVKVMSERILPILDRKQYLEKYPQLVDKYDLVISKYLDIICGKKSEECYRLGALAGENVLSQVVTILKNNKPDDLVHIMLIHYAFIDVFRELPYCLPVFSKPMGKFAALLKESWKASEDMMDYFGESGLGNIEDNQYRHFVDRYLYKRRIFGDYDRGRGELLPATHPNAASAVMGVMLPGDEDGLPSYQFPSLPYCRIQQPDLTSPYVLDLINNDCVYVSGPSGLTTIFLGLMEMIGSFPSIEHKQNYLTAVVAYLVATGHHSIHEMLMPAQDGLNLIPGYHVSVPMPSQLAKPPNYYQFYQQQQRIDPEFASRRDEAWNKTLNYYAAHYLNKKSGSHLCSLQVKHKPKSDEFRGQVIRKVL